MQTYTLKDAHNQYGEIFEQAKVAPVSLMEESHPSHVIMSAKTYQQLICKLAELEYLVLGQQAEAALSCSYLLGVRVHIHINFKTIGSQ